MNDLGCIQRKMSHFHEIENIRAHNRIIFSNNKNVQIKTNEKKKQTNSNKKKKKKTAAVAERADEVKIL